MDGDGCARVCPECRREVSDVQMMDAPRAEAFLAEHLSEPPKLSLLRRPDGRVVESECPRGLRERRARQVLRALFAVAVAIGGALALVR
jgi:hypothetical protein